MMLWSCLYFIFIWDFIYKLDEEQNLMYLGYDIKVYLVVIFKLEIVIIF